MAEIDRVAWHGATLVFVEVKTRKTAECGLPEESVDAEKRSRILAGRAGLCPATGVAWEFTRFDIVSVMMQTAPANRVAEGRLSTMRRAVFWAEAHGIIVSCPSYETTPSRVAG